MKNPLAKHIAAAGLLAASTISFAAGGLSVEREVTVDAPPSTVWKLIGNFNALDVWHPAVAASTQKGNGTSAGSTRVLSLAGGGSIDEKMTGYKAGKSYSYAITKSPLPVKNYVSTLTVGPSGEGKSVIKWTSTFDANGADDAKAKEVIGGVYDAGLGRAQAIFKK